MDYHMNGAMAEKHSPIDYGVQIRFINNLKEPSKSQKIRTKTAKPGSYGVAVRVQGIDGQPFVVLNSGEKGGDSFGVQIKSENKYGASVQSQRPEELASPSTASLSKDVSGSLSSDSDLPENPYASKLPRYNSQYSTSDEEQGPRRCARVPTADNLESSLSYPSSGGSSVPQSGYRTLPLKKAFGEQLRRTQSHSSLLSPDLEEPGEPSPLRTQPSNSSQFPPAGGATRSTSMMNLTSRKVPSPREDAGGVSGLKPVNKKPLLDTGSPEPPQPAHHQGGSDIDTKPLSSVDSLINKFDGKSQQRGRAARRSRVSLDDRKRSQSLDGRVAFHDTADLRELDGAERPAGFQEGPRASSAKQLALASSAGNRSLSRTAGQQPKENGVDKTKLTRDWVNKSLEDPVVDQEQSKAEPELQVILPQTLCLVCVLEPAHIGPSSI